MITYWNAYLEELLKEFSEEEIKAKPLPEILEGFFHFLDKECILITNISEVKNLIELRKNLVVLKNLSTKIVGMVSGDIPDDGVFISQAELEGLRNEVSVLKSAMLQVVEAIEQWQWSLGNTVIINEEDLSITQ